MEKTIVFDMDGCLADFVKGFTELGNRLYGIPVRTVTTQETWDGFGATKEQKNTIWETLKQDQMFWWSLDPLINPVTFARIDSLAMRSRVYFLTTRVGIKVKQQTERWLHFHGVYNPTVIICPNMHDKGNFCKLLGATHAIEDKVENALSIDTVSKAKTFLLDRPYNREPLDNVGPTQVRRVYTMPQFLDEVENG